MALTTFRHFCAASRVLDVYQDKANLLRQEKELCKSLRDAVALSLRTENVCLPDHQHHNRMREFFPESDKLPDMLLKALGAGEISPRHGNIHCLEVRHGRMYVCGPQLEDWQREVTAYQSPVPVMAAAWLRHCRQNGHDLLTTMPYLLKTLEYSTLPGVNDGRLQGMIQSADGTEGRLSDLHVHINGSTEFTPVWVHSLEHQHATNKEFAKAENNQHKKVTFFHKQLRTDLNTLRKRLYMASVLRYWLCRHLQSHTAPMPREEIPRLEHVSSLFNGGCTEVDMPLGHPFKHELLPAGAHAVQCEGAMWLYALTVLHETKDHVLAVLMHSYLLLMHQHLRLLVQQPEQYGFDQFQYITLAGAREAAESAGDSGFQQRFRQFFGMYGPDMAHVEARFAPKATPKENNTFIQRIWNDYLAATGQNHEGTIPCAACPRLAQQFRMHEGELRPHQSAAQPRQPKAFTLGLVAHFIKTSDDGKGPCRHHKLRDRLAQQAQALVAFKKSVQASQPLLHAALVGKDAASNELDAPPETFAPAFRYLNREGITHTTYHAGEDFEHMLCGMRAVHEAMLFLDMHSKDRIGHATALGIDPAQCGVHSVYCRQGQWLDSLVWLTWLIHRTPALRSFGGEIALTHSVIVQLYNDIYEETCPPLPVLWKAWELRKHDPRFIDSDAVPVHQNSTLEYRIRQEEERSCGTAQFKSACQELRKYHAKRARWNTIITIHPDEQPSRDLLQAVQDAIITEMRDKNILVEVLPTSNVRISHYTATEDHHVMRWLNPDDPRPAPQVVLGTDDPGIFSTTLRNEYSLVLQKLQKLYPGHCEKPYEILRHLIENGLCYRF